MKKKSIILLFVAVLALALAACGNKDTGSGKSTSDSKTAKACAAYQKVLEDNKSSIDKYSWQTNATKKEDSISRPVALTDINGDKIPELFFMSAVSDYEADLQIYTYSDGKAQKVSYKMTENDNTYDSYADVAAGGGSRYVIYRTKNDPDLFAILGITTDESSLYYLSSYDTSKLSSDCTLTESSTLTNIVSVYPSSDTYKKNGTTISNSEGKKAFSESFSSMDKVIMFSGYDSSCSIWKHFKPSTAASKSYDDMIDYLGSKSN